MVSIRVNGEVSCVDVEGVCVGMVRVYGLLDPCDGKKREFPNQQILHGLRNESGWK